MGKFVLKSIFPGEDFSFIVGEFDSLDEATSACNEPDVTFERDTSVGIPGQVEVYMSHWHVVEHWLDL
jgi:hypothetical protein